MSGYTELKITLVDFAGNTELKRQILVFHFDEDATDDQMLLSINIAEGYNGDKPTSAVWVEYMNEEQVLQLHHYLKAAIQAKFRREARTKMP